MIQLLTGDNDYELTKQIARLKADFNGTAERYDASEMSKEQLADIFAGQSLFSMARLIILDTPSANSDLWTNIADWDARLSDDTQMVLVEPKPDKRTSTYKWLKKNADIVEFPNYGEHDSRGVESWATTYAKANDVQLTQPQLRRIVHRAGHDQWQVASAIDKLSLLETVNDEWINSVIEATASENVFMLFETVLNGDNVRLLDMMETLRLTEDPYRLFGLINSQALQLTALTYGDGDANKVANDIGAKSAYPLQKLAPFAGRTSRQQAAQMVAILAAADLRLKSSDADPWLVLESTLARVASLRT